MIEQLLMADRLLTVDMVDQAEAAYASVAAADPRNAMAVVGLARCALARADDRAAYELAARALTIDPEDDMARRMEARLFEVLTLRGEALTRPPVAAEPTRHDLRPVVASGPAPASTAPPAGTGATRGHRSLLDRLRGR